MMIQLVQNAGVAYRTSTVIRMYRYNEGALDKNVQARFTSRLISEDLRVDMRDIGPYFGVVGGVVGGVLRPIIHQYITDAPTNFCSIIRSSFDQGSYEILGVMFNSFEKKVGWRNVISNEILMVGVRLFVETSQIGFENVCGGSNDYKSSMHQGGHTAMLLTFNSLVHLASKGLVNLAIAGNPVGLAAAVSIELIDVTVITIAYDYDLTFSQKVLSISTGIAVGTICGAVSPLLVGFGAGLTSTAAVYCTFKGHDKCGEQIITAYDTVTSTLGTAYNSFTNILGQDTSQYSDL